MATTVHLTIVVMILSGNSICNLLAYSQVNKRLKSDKDIF